MENLKIKTKEDYLSEWVTKALFYTRKERDCKIKPKPGEIYTCDFGQNVGSEINGVRPAMVLTSTSYNDNSGVVTVIPCSLKEFAKQGQIRIDEKILKEGKVSGVVKVEMITTVSKGRLGKYVGCLNNKGIRLVGNNLAQFLKPLKEVTYNNFNK